MGDEKTFRSCAIDVLKRIAQIEERLAKIETRLTDHINREEKAQSEMQWLLRLVTVTWIGLTGYLLINGSPWL